MVSLVCLLLPAILLTVVREYIFKKAHIKEQTSLKDRIVFFIFAVLLLNWFISFVLRVFFNNWLDLKGLFEALNSILRFSAKYLLLAMAVCTVELMAELSFRTGWIHRLRSKLIVIFVIEAVLVASFAVGIVRTVQTERSFNGNTHGIMQKFDDVYVLADEDKGVNPAKAVLVYNFSTVQQGTYRGEIYYKADDSQSISFSCSEDRYLMVNDMILDHRQDKVFFYMTVTHPVDHFEISINYKGNGDFSVSNVVLYQSVMGYLRNMTFIILLFSLMEWMLVYFDKHPERRQVVFGLLSIAAIAFIPYMVSGVYVGHDFIDHFSRIEGITEEIRNGQFPVYMQMSWFSGYGTPFSIYYGDSLLYIPVFFRLVGFSFNTSYKIFVFLINFFTAVFSYYAFKRIFKRDNIAWILTFAYVCAPYRLIDIYVRSAVGEYIAIMFLPLICVGFYGILTYESAMRTPGQKQLGIYKYSFILACGMSGIICSHILSAEMTVFILLIVTAVFIKQIFTLERVKALCVSVLQCILMALFFIVPFVDSYLSNETVMSHRVNNIRAMQQNGAYIGQYFAFFQDIFGGASVFTQEDRMYLSIGMVLMSVLVAAMVIIYKKKGNHRMLFYLCMSILTLWLSSNVFPWDAVSYFSTIGNLIPPVNFPWRYLMYTTLFAVLALGEVLIWILDKSDENYRKYFKAICFGVCILAALDTVRISSNYISQYGRDYIYNTSEKEWNTVDDYVRHGTNIDNLTYEVLAENAAYSNVKRKGTSFTLDCTTGESGGTVSVPILNYKGWHATDSHGNAYDIYDGENNEITFSLPANYDGTIYVDFVPPFYWTLAWWISIVGSLILFIGIVKVYLFRLP